MATRRYRKSSNKSKKSLKKRGSRRRKNIRSSRRMRGGIPNLLDLFKKHQPINEPVPVVNEPTPVVEPLPEYEFTIDQKYTGNSKLYKGEYELKPDTIYTFIKLHETGYCLKKGFYGDHNNDFFNDNIFIDSYEYKTMLDRKFSLGKDKKEQAFQYKNKLIQSNHYLFSRNNGDTNVSFNSCTDKLFLASLTLVNE